MRKKLILILLCFSYQNCSSINTKLLYGLGIGLGLSIFIKGIQDGLRFSELKNENEKMDEKIDFFVLGGATALLRIKKLLQDKNDKHILDAELKSWNKQVLMSHIEYYKQLVKYRRIILPILGLLLTKYSYDRFPSK